MASVVIGCKDEIEFTPLTNVEIEITHPSNNAFLIPGEMVYFGGKLTVQDTNFLTKLKPIPLVGASGVILTQI